MPYIATSPQTVTLKRSPHKKINLPAMPVEDELSYYQSQQFTYPMTLLQDQSQLTCQGPLQDIQTFLLVLVNSPH